MPKTYDLKHTHIAKGFFVLVMIFHHIFAVQMNYWINFAAPATPDFNNLIMEISSYGKACVGGFCFLSAYGITTKLKFNTNLKYKNLIIPRLVKLYFSFWPIYIFGLIGTYLWGNTLVSQIYSSPITGRFSFFLPLADVLGFSNLLSLGTLNRSWWYIGAAVFIIILTPLTYKLFVRFGYVFAIIVCIVPYIIGANTYSILITIAMLGIIFAHKDILSTVKTKLYKHYYTRIAAYILILMALFLSFPIAAVTSISSAMPISTIICVMFCYIILSDIPIIRTILEFLGKHSANIFYLHSFIFLYWFTYTIYNLKNKLAIYCVVVAISLFISIAVEYAKKLVHYNQLQQLVITHLCKPICKKDF